MQRKASPVGRITRKEIDVADVIRSVGDGGAGAIVLFLGTVRDSSEAGKVDRLSYEAYEPMAEKRLLEVEEEVKRIWPSTRKVRIVHRVGESLSVGDVSVAVAVSSEHRAEAFEACRHAIERIKRDVPIWKKERLADGSEVWVEGRRMGSGLKAQGRGDVPRHSAPR